MNMTGRWMERLNAKWIMPGIILSVALGYGCVSGSSGPWKIYVRPILPLAITNPEQAFLRCDTNPRTVESDYYCIDKDHLLGLKVFIIETEGLVKKYENQINEINAME
jgi:hypothetical protein